MFINTESNLLGKRKMNAIRSVLERTDRIIADKDVRVVVEWSPTGRYKDCPGWTDGRTVTLNGAMLTMKDMSLAATVLCAKALNFHELCHVLYTPRNDTDMIRWILNPTSFGELHEDAQMIPNAFNVLEDQRIEMMFTAKYRPSIPYFSAIVLRWILNNANATPTVFALIYGRSYLDQKIIDRAEADFTQMANDWRHPEVVEQLKEVIDDYCTIQFPKDTLKAKILIRKFVQIMQKLQKNPAGMTMGAQDVSQIFGAANKQQQAEGAAAIVKARAEQKQKDDDDSADDDSGDDDSGHGSGQGADNDEEVDSGIDGQEGASDAGNGESDVDTGAGGASSDDEDSVSPQTGHGAGFGGEDPEGYICDEIREALDRLLEDEAFQDELAEAIGAIKSAMDSTAMVADGVFAYHTMAPVSAESQLASRKMARTLRDLRVELEETHNRRQEAGAIDTVRYLTRNAWETDFFQTYEPGAIEDTSIEAVIMVDLSGSMAGVMHMLSESLWTAKRALEEVDARVTVLGYSGTCYLLMQPDEKASPNSMKLFGHKSTTNPTDALMEAHRLLDGSDRSIKMLLSQTDGAWQGNQNKQNDIVKSLRAMDVTTVMMHLYTGGWANDIEAHGHEIVMSIDSTDDIAKVANKIVQEAMRKNIDFLQGI